ncbi:hypothetical protein CJU89_3860 [Yarrowia sp. B02]|nr:hypothetical protein CJU89_3860 [Yarrowia sp. B02]
MKQLKFQIAKKWGPTIVLTAGPVPISIPKNLLEVLQAPDYDDWKDLMEAELTELFKSKKLVPVKKDKSVDLKHSTFLPWVFNATEEGRIAKTPLCDSITCPVGPNKVTLSFLLNVACQHNWYVEQATLNDSVSDGDIFIQPDQFMRGVIRVEGDHDYLLKVNKPENFYLSFFHYVSNELGFTVSWHDPNMFLKFSEDGKPQPSPTILILHGRDCVVINANKERAKKYKQLLSDKFPGGNETGLVIKQDVNQGLVEVNMSKRAEDILRLFKDSPETVESELEMLSCLRQDLDLTKPIQEVVRTLSKTKGWKIKFENEDANDRGLETYTQTTSAIRMNYGRSGFCWIELSGSNDYDYVMSNIFQCTEYTVHFRMMLQEMTLLAGQPLETGGLPRSGEDYPTNIEVEDVVGGDRTNSLEFPWLEWIRTPMARAQYVYLQEQVNYKVVTINGMDDEESIQEFEYFDPRNDPLQFQRLLSLFDPAGGKLERKRSFGSMSFF